MTLVAMRDILRRATDERYAVGYFESWDFRSLECVASAAENKESPVILGFGCSQADEDWLARIGIRYYAKIGRLVADKTSIPACLLLNEAGSLPQILQGIKHGFNAVMLSSPNLSIEENMSLNRLITSIAHPLQVAVEGELGRIPDATQMAGDRADFLTKPDEAERYVKETAVDALAISVGNIHELTSGEAQIDMDRLARIGELVDVPLVIHGGTGFPRRLIGEAINCGVAKFNVGTILKTTYLEGMVDTVHSGKRVKENVHVLMGSRRPGDLQAEACQNMVRRVEELTELYGSAGKSWA